MTSGVRFGAAQARMRALKSRLWTPLDRPLLLQAGLEPDGRPLTDDPRDTWAGLARWYATFVAIYPSGAALFGAMFRRHEIENVKLLWRAARRARPPDPLCWRPLNPLASVSLPFRVETIGELVDRLGATPYAPIARTLTRTVDAALTEIGLDRWVWEGLWRHASALPGREAVARDLVRLLVLEHDVNLLRRGTSFGIAPDQVAKATVLMGKQERIATDMDPLDLRRRRGRACRRAFVGWPFQLGPAVAALLLREEQARGVLSIAAARRGLETARDALPLALAAGPLEG